MASIHEEIADWQKAYGVVLTPDASADLKSIIEGREEEAAEGQYDDGYACGKAHAEDQKPDTSWLEDLRDGLALLKTDRAAALVYLDRCTLFANRQLIEVVNPCLL